MSNPFGVVKNQIVTATCASHSDKRGGHHLISGGKIEGVRGEAGGCCILKSGLTVFPKFAKGPHSVPQGLTSSDLPCGPHGQRYLSQGWSGGDPGDPQASHGNTPGTP